MNKEWELVIIGGGPAGLAAGLYATRSGLNTLLIERSAIGGQAITSDRIENYPGFSEPVSGAELMEKMKMQAVGFGLETQQFSAVSAVKPDKEIDILMSNGDIYHAGASIIATGSEPKWLDVPGAERLKGRGVSYCATCDGPFFKGRPVLVVGGGNAAIEEALYLTRFVSKVYISHRRDKLRADEVLQRRAFKEKKIELLWNNIVREIIGSDRVERAVLEDVKKGGISEIAVSGIFIYIGTVPNTEFLQGIVELDDQGYIITDSDMATSSSGIYAAGDCRHKKLRQIVTAVGEGATAAMTAYHYIEDKKTGIN